jgi:transcription-repair coupling factor (superfamily II helicase)
MFGLAQLYQLRGRVGRSDRQAYAYLLVPSSRRLGDQAAKRLKALQSLDDLGVGFNLALHDLEIRGAGNLLGKEQSGSVAAVGYELYSKILKEAVLNLKGEELPLEELIEPEVKLGYDAFISDIYIPDVSERLVLYQRLAALRDSDETDQLIEEMVDRFGPMTEEALNLLESMRLRSLLRRYGVVSAEQKANRLALVFSPKAPIDINAVLQLAKEHPDRYRFNKNLTLSWVPDSGVWDDCKELYRATNLLLESISSKA